MQSHDPHAQRFEDLEIKVTHLEDTVEQLNTQVYQQAVQLDRLQRLLSLMNERLATDTAGGTFRSLRDELPPHY